MRKLIVVGPGLLILGLLLSIFYYFRVEHIVVEGTKQLSSLHMYDNKSLFFINPINMQQQIIKNNPTIQEARVRIEYPQTLHISVIESAPVAKLVLQDGTILLSQTGKILAKQSESSDKLVAIIHYQPLYNRNFKVGQVIDMKEVVDAAFFIEEFHKLNMPVSNVDIRNESMIVLSSEGREVLVSATKDVQLQAAQLRVVIEQFRAKALSFSRLDLRFEKPIVVYKK